MDFHDFPGFLGNLGVYLIQPPKLCAGLLHALGKAPTAILHAVPSLDTENL